MESFLAYLTPLVSRQGPDGQQRQHIFERRSLLELVCLRHDFLKKEVQVGSPSADNTDPF